jgi:anti-sigma regulatory factor (Ser/Thr protein kinase)
MYAIDVVTQLKSPLVEGSSTFAARFIRTPDAVRAARRLVVDHFGGVLGVETLDDVQLVVSELVTNAVRYGRGDVDLRMAFDGRKLTGAVSDEGRGFRRRSHQHDPLRVGGHGLYIVGRVSEAWGMGEGHTSVWFQMLARR